MSNIFTGKIKSARFINPPENSVIELLYGEANELTAFHLEINYSNQEFLDFIEEWPLEKIEKAARTAARERAQFKENYDKQIIDNVWIVVHLCIVTCIHLTSFSLPLSLSLSLPLPLPV